MKQGKLIPKESRIVQLEPFLDEKNILRAKGRLNKLIEHNFSILHPVILDSRDAYTRLLIRFYHEKYFHGSHESIVNELRQKYWIVGLRRAIRSIVSNCDECKLQRAKPCQPKMADLPSSRAGYRLQPFTHCGLDFFGPMEVKIGRRREKRYGVMFTCMTIRAIHLELASELSSDSTMMAIKRFIGRRGRPKIIYCDNCRNFKGVNNELKKLLKEVNYDELENNLARKEIKFSFNPPTASHMGGAWERLILSVKCAINVVLKGQVFKEELLSTTLIEIEHCVNSRPLTHVSVDPRDQEALAPNHFLIGSSSCEIKLGSYDRRNLCSRQEWRLAQAFADSFWQRWLREYAPTLLSRKKWFDRSEGVGLNDIVLIVDLEAPRNVWRKGRVVELFPGKDEAVRSVRVETRYGEFVRPFRRLVKLLSDGSSTK